MIRIKRYAVSLSLNLGSSARIDHDYWPRPRTAFLHQFQPIAQRYRRRRRTGLYLFVAFMVFGFALTYIPVPETVRLGGFFVLMATWFAAVALFLFGLKLRCPACRKRLEPAKGRYCPQCGSDQFQQDTRWGVRDRYCPSCVGTIAEEDGDSARNYKIRGCTHCGVMLDEMGV